MDLEQARLDIVNWIADFVEQPHPKLNNWSPCPFARKARLDNKIKIRRGRDPYADLMNFVKLEPYDVVIFVYDATTISAQEFERQVYSVNKTFLTTRNLIALSDHPDSPEIVNDVSMNQGTYALIFIQDCEKLNQSAESLAAKGYYQDWPEDYMQSLFSFRKDPRNAQ